MVVSASTTDRDNGRRIVSLNPPGLCFFCDNLARVFFAIFLEKFLRLPLSGWELCLGRFILVRPLLKYIVPFSLDKDMSGYNRSAQELYRDSSDKVIDTLFLHPFEKIRSHQGIRIALQTTGADILEEPVMKYIVFCLSMTFAIFAFGCQSENKDSELVSNEQGDGDKKKHMIVLVHGLLGWGDSSDGVEYFGKVKGRLQEMGFTVLTPTLGGGRSSTEAGGYAGGQTLLNQLGDSSNEGFTFHLFAHSQGALDARYAQHQDEQLDESRIASLTTFAGVNGVVPITKVVEGILSIPFLRDWLNNFLNAYGDKRAIDSSVKNNFLGALESLSDEGVNSFNATFKNQENNCPITENGIKVEGVCRFSFLGDEGGVIGGTGDGDGLVPVESQKYGHVVKTLQVGHLEMAHYRGPERDPHGVVDTYVEHACALGKAFGFAPEGCNGINESANQESQTTSEAQDQDEETLEESSDVASQDQTASGSCTVATAGNWQDLAKAPEPGCVWCEIGLGQDIHATEDVCKSKNGTVTERGPAP